MTSYAQTAAGTNAYAVLSSPRTSGNEAIVISASWLSRIDESSTSDSETINIRGVATVLALAKFLRGYSLWAKDLVFVISDGHLDGMHAWLSAYHGVSQSSSSGLLSYGAFWSNSCAFNRHGRRLSQALIRCHMDRAEHRLPRALILTSRCFLWFVPPTRSSRAL